MAQKNENLKLDFSIERDTARNTAVSNFIEANPTKKYTSKELETYANYILYGKDENGENFTTRKEGDIESRYSTYKRRDQSSIEELMEMPGFDQLHFKPVKRSVYTNPKPELDKSKPEIQALSNEIERIENLFEYYAQNNLKSETELYHLKHFIISLRKEQYILQDELSPKFFKKTDQKQYYEPIDVLDIDVFPLGLKSGNLIRFTNPKDAPKKPLEFEGTDLYLDFCDPLHVYLLLEAYPFLYRTSIDNPFTNTKYLVETIDFYIKKANLPAERQFILEAKRAGLSNIQIKERLIKNFGKSYNENYISTIYKGDICKRIRTRATLHEEEYNRRGKEELWKKCSECGEYKLKKVDFFGKKASSPDGLKSICKDCEKKKKKKRT